MKVIQSTINESIKNVFKQLSKTNNLVNLRPHRNLDNRMKAIYGGLHPGFSLEIKPEQD
jgi:hypothetical protein